MNERDWIDDVDVDLQYPGRLQYYFLTVGVARVVGFNKISHENISGKRAASEEVSWPAWEKVMVQVRNEREIVGPTWLLLNVMHVAKHHASKNGPLMPAEMAGVMLRC